MARQDRLGKRQSREQRRKQRIPELGYYLVVTDTEATERCYSCEAHKSYFQEGKNNMINCIALDLDRTTLDPQGKLTQEVRAAICEAFEAGIEVVVASGRALRSLPQEVLALEELRYAITSNGAAVYDLAEGKCLIRHTLPEKAVRKILEVGRAYGAGIEVFVEGQPFASKAYVEDPQAFGATAFSVPYVKRTRKPVEDFEAFLEENLQRLDCMDLVVPAPLQKEVEEVLREKTEGIYLTSSIAGLIEISDEKSGKHRGAAFLMEHFGWEKEALAAFGDGDNDAELLSYAGIGIAVANASKNCKAAADWITNSNAQNGVAVGIRCLLKRREQEEISCISRNR